MRSQWGKLKSLIPAIILLLIPVSMLIAEPRVNSITMNPPNPAFGDVVDITIDYCAQLYNDAQIAVAISSQAVKDNADLSGTGQVFVVSEKGIDVLTSQPASSPGGVIDWLANASPGGGTADCNTCAGTNDGKHFVRTYTVHVPPAAYFPGCSLSTLYLHVGMKDSNMNTGNWQGMAACSSGPVLSWTMPLLPKGFTFGKRVEGVLQAQNDLVLFSIDYEYENGQLVLTDSIPGGGDLTLVSWGPQSFTGGSAVGPAIGSTTGNFTWTLPNRATLNGKAQGTVWMLYKINVAAPVLDKKYANTATGAMSGVANQNASASILVGRSAITITKDESDTAPNWGDQITYMLTYQINGSRLIAYQPFDDIGNGVYGDPAGTGGTPPTGWKFNPQGGVNGQWTVSDPCNTGDRQIMGDATAGDKYPSLLYTGLPAANHMCKGIIMSDVLLVPGGYEGADAMVVIRSNDVPGGKAYGLVLSVDDNIGTNGNGNIGFQRCDGATCVWPLSVNTLAITSNKWWRVKIQIDPANQYHFQAKVWARGDPEPSAWTIDWTDAAPPAGFDCNSGDAWKPGIAEQHGASGDVHDTYNNFIIYEPRFSANTYVWDTPPAGVAYVGQQGPHPLLSSPNPIKWTLGMISDEGGTFTWWGTVNTCNPLTNDGWINGDPPMVANKSNVVIAVPVCPELSGITKTANVVQASVGDTITWTITYCNDGHSTIANYVITDPIPPGMNCLGCTTGVGTCSCGPPVTFTIGAVAPGTCNVAVKWWGKVTAP